MYEMREKCQEPLEPLLSIKLLNIPSILIYLLNTITYEICAILDQVSQRSSAGMNQNRYSVCISFSVKCFFINIRLIFSIINSIEISILNPIGNYYPLTSDTRQ